MGIEKQYDAGDTAQKYAEASIENLETNDQVIKYVNEHGELLTKYKKDLVGKRTVKKRRKRKADSDL
jgi:hypothetical protein